jgi:hypothetical protein
LSAALTEIGAQTQGKTGIGGVATPNVVQTTAGATPVSSPVSYGGYSYTEMSDGTVQRINEENGKTAVISSDAWSQIKEGIDPSVLAGQTPAGTLAPVTVVGSTTLLDTTYNLLSNGGAEYIDDRGTKRTLSPQEWTIEQNQLGGTAAPTLAPKTVVATTLPPSLDTQILSLMNATEAPTLFLGTVAPTLPPVTVAPTTGLPTNPPWWDQMTAAPTLPVVTLIETTGPVTLAPTLPVVTVSATTEFPTIPPTLPVTAVPTLPPVTISPTTELPTLPPTLPPVTLGPVTIFPTTELPTLPPTLPPPTRTFPPVTITPTTETPTLPPTLPPETSPPVTTLPPATTAPPTSKPTSRPTKEPTYPVVISVTPEPRPRAPSTITGVSPARLLADALTAYRPAGAIEGEESGKERQNVWNEKSLRLKDALGL